MLYSTAAVGINSMKLLDKGAIAFYNMEQFKQKGGCFMEHALKAIIAACDKAIQEERFDALMDYYTEDAVLIIRPGQQAQGRAAIKKAFQAIAQYFKNNLTPTQGVMQIIEAGDTALVLSQTLLDAPDKQDSAYSMERRATYVFRKVEGQWLCAVDNSYGTDLLDALL